MISAIVVVDVVMFLLLLLVVVVVAVVLLMMMKKVKLLHTLPSLAGLSDYLDIMLMYVVKWKM